MPSLPGRECTRAVVAERHESQPVTASRRNVADGDRHALGDVGLTPVGGAEMHRRGRVEHEPRDQHALREMHANVRDVGTRSDVPVDPAHVVVSRNVGTNLSELRSVAEQRRAIVARKQAFHPPPDADVERTQQRIR